MTTTYKRNALALSALFFCAPLVQYFLHREGYGCSTQEKGFIRGYVILGYIALVAVVAMMTFVGMSIFTDLYRGKYVADALMYSTSAVLLLGSLGVILHIPLFTSGSFGLKTKTVPSDPIHFIKSYLPGYNFYLRCTHTNYEKPTWRVKESVFLRTVFVVCVLVFQYTFVNILILLLILGRLFSLLGEIDVVPLRIKNHIHRLFHTNIEELRGYITGTIGYFFHKLFYKEKTLTRHHCVDNEKKAYTTHQVCNIRTRKDQSVLSILGSASGKLCIEYALGIAFMGYMLYQHIMFDVMIAQTPGTMFRYIAFGILTMRYVFAWYYQKIPHLPVFHEIVALIEIGSKWVYKKARK